MVFIGNTWFLFSSLKFYLLDGLGLLCDLSTDPFSYLSKTHGLNYCPGALHIDPICDWSVCFFI